MIQTAMIVCEGACNGGLVQDYDDAVMRAGRSKSFDDDDQRTTSLVHPTWLATARTLKHTPHVYRYGTDRAVYACSTCHQVRVFGAVMREDVDSRERVSV